MLFIRFSRSTNIASAIGPRQPVAAKLRHRQSDKLIEAPLRSMGHVDLQSRTQTGAMLVPHPNA